MDSSISSILRRMNVQKIRNDVIWDGEAQGEPDPRVYDERLQEAEQKVIDGISAVKDNPGPETQDTAAQEVRGSAGNHQGRIYHHWY